MPASTANRLESISQLTTVAERLLGALRRSALVAAIHLARSGQFDEAERKLRESESYGGPDAESLDLLARIRVQQGRLGEAESLWIEAGRFAPGDSAIAQALSVVRDVQRRAALPVWQRFRSVAVVLIGVAVALPVVWQHLRESRLLLARQVELLDGVRTDARQASDRTQQQLEQLAREQLQQKEELRRQNDAVVRLAAEETAGREAVLRLGSLLAESDAAARSWMARSEQGLQGHQAATAEGHRRLGEKLQSGLDQLRGETEKVRAILSDLENRSARPAAVETPAVFPDLAAMTGLRAQLEGSTLVVWLTSRCFYNGVTLLRGGAKDTLGAFAKKLAPADGASIHVEVLGLPVEGSPFSSPEKLAYRRAAIIAHQIRTGSGLSGDRVTARAATAAEVAAQSTRLRPLETVGTSVILLRLQSENRR